jgi:hypothetical protein
LIDVIPPGGLPDKVKFYKNQKLLWDDSQRLKQQNMQLGEGMIDGDQMKSESDSSQE